ncbi:MAG TPA: glycosyltransferase family A protein [Opitutaceae bacterium]
MNVQLPIVSVVIPAYNAAVDLSSTLESVRRQSLREFEVLVVNDGSTDGTSAVAREFVRRDPRFRLLEQDNRGVGDARNHAIRLARGTYIAPLDSDDRWHPDKLAKQVARIEEAGPRTGLVYCWSRKIDRQGGVLSNHFPYSISGYHPGAMLLRNFAGNASVPLFRASALRDAGPYLTRADQHGIQGCEDWDMHIRVAELYAVGVVTEYLMDYVQASTCLSLDLPNMSASGKFVLQRVRERNPHLPAAVFRWSAGHFYCYLSHKCHRWGNYAGALRAARLALAADPVNLLNPQLRAISGRSLGCLLVRGGVRSPTPSPAILPGPCSTARGARWFARIEARRWAAVLNTTHADQSTGSLTGGPVAPALSRWFQL